ncbi:MAG: hypothetical protein VCA55_01735 [Verrucomicrobiales bacterium]
MTLENALGENSTQHEDYLERLNGKYIGKLKYEQARMLKIKAMKAAVALDGEIGRIESGDSTRSSEIDAAPDHVRTMRGQYEQFFARVNNLKHSRDGEARFEVDRKLEVVQVVLTRANQIDDALAVRNFRDLLLKSLTLRAEKKPPETAPVDPPVDPDPSVDPDPPDPPDVPDDSPGLRPVEPVSAISNLPEPAYRDDVPRPMTSSEREKYAAGLGPPPEKSGRGYAVMLTSIQRGEVKSINVSKIKGWGPARPQIWNSKPYWTATVTYPTTSLFGTFDTEGMAIISGNRVVEWLYTGSGEEIP